MGLTKFLRKFLNLLSYNKSYNSLSIFLLTAALTFVGLTSIIMAALSEKDVDKSLEAFKDAVSISIVFVCNIERERTLKLVQLIDDEFVVNRDELVERKDKMWLEFGMLYDRKREDIKMKLQYLTRVMVVIYCGYLSKHFLNQAMGIEAQSEENGQTKWPTPFLYPSSEFQSSSLILYNFTLQSLLLASTCTGGYLMLTSVMLSIEKLLADFEAMYMLLEYVSNEFPDSSHNNDGKIISQYGQNDKNSNRKNVNLRGDMARIVKCHQIINRNFKICADCSALVITSIIAEVVNDSCSNAYFMLKATNVKKAVSFTFMFIIQNLTMFFLFQYGQRIFNQNDILRKSLAELPWTDKPRWFRQTVHIMMTRANVDIEMKPYGIFILNYMSFKDVMKFTFSVGNLLYTKKLRSQSQK